MYSVLTVLLSEKPNKQQSVLQSALPILLTNLKQDCWHSKSYWQKTKKILGTPNLLSNS